jgi:hypothetical protein
MEAMSTPYTCFAPALAANIDRMPVPQPTAQQSERRVQFDGFVWRCAVGSSAKSAGASNIRNDGRQAEDRCSNAEEARAGREEADKTVSSCLDKQEAATRNNAHAQKDTYSPSNTILPLKRCLLLMIERM